MKMKNGLADLAMKHRGISLMAKLEKSQKKHKLRKML
jgi:hypothetical protein